MTAPSSLSANMTVFIVFFGVSVLDAFVTRAWWRAAFWMVIAAVFLVADRIGRQAAALRPDRIIGRGTEGAGHSPLAAAQSRP